MRAVQRGGGVRERERARGVIASSTSAQQQQHVRPGHAFVHADKKTNLKDLLPGANLKVAACKPREDIAHDGLDLIDARGVDEPPVHRDGEAVVLNRRAVNRCDCGGQQLKGCAERNGRAREGSAEGEERGSVSDVWSTLTHAARGRAHSLPTTQTHPSAAWAESAYRLGTPGHQGRRCQSRGNRRTSDHRAG